jgi:hypothetical protein
MAKYILLNHLVDDSIIQEVFDIELFLEKLKELCTIESNNDYRTKEWSEYNKKLLFLLESKPETKVKIQ